MMQHILADMTVHEEQVRENVLHAAPLISSEALMFFIGTKIGKENAHALVYAVSMEALENNRPVLDVLLERPEVRGKFRRKEIEQAIQPDQHIGMAKELSRRTVDAVKAKMQELGEIPAQRSQGCPLAERDETCPLKCRLTAR
jgi:adenylosuccinate lyase